MTRTTIDFGIDLGTTNSSIALLKGMEVVVFKNNEGFEITPSAVWLDENNRLYVGRTARERLEHDPQNSFSEFKLQMGTDIEYVFERSSRSMKPENLSAEVLKSLKADVKRRTGEDIRAAVITVPAAFEMPQIDATRKAAELAGFSQVLLPQEPLAAALSYGFLEENEKVFWMVYDFGGGTFDAAVIQVRDGEIVVVSHGGDNHLGGKLIDWAVVDQLLIPEVRKKHCLEDFSRHNLKWRTAIAKLKLNAEKAKIRVSLDDSTEIYIDNLYKKNNGVPVAFKYELKRKDVERLAEPFILRSINICKSVLREGGLKAKHIGKIILVGGTTLMPLLRERLADTKEGLGIPLEFDVDPLTVVARGAATFAAGKKIETPPGPVTAGHFLLQLEYEPIGADEKPLVGGKVISPAKDDLSGFTIEFVNTKSKPPYTSGKIQLSPDGKFKENLWAEKGKENIFAIELYDAKGTKCETKPDHLTYKIGILVTDPILIHSVGVGLANNEMKWFLEKGRTLPARRRIPLKTAVKIRKGKKGDVIRIPVKEGRNKRADRNREVGKLEIKEHQVKEDVPQGSEVEVIIKIDENRLMHVEAYIPFLDEGYKNVVKLGYVEIDCDKMKKEFEFENSRLEELQKKAMRTKDPTASKVLTRIEGEQMVEHIQDSLEAPGDDFDALAKGDKRLLDLKVALDEAEDALEWPSLFLDAKSLLKTASGITREHGDTDDIKSVKTYSDEVEENLETGEVDLLEESMSNLHKFLINILDRKEVLESMFFESMCRDRKKIPTHDQEKASRLIIKGQRALNANDNVQLKDINDKLSVLFPSPPEPPRMSDVF